MNKAEYKFTCQARGGHHAIIFFLLGLIPKGKTCCFRNHICRKADWRENKLLTKMPSRCGRYVKDRLHSLGVTYGGDEANYYVYNLEDLYDDTFTFGHGKMHTIVVIRNVYNHLASYLGSNKDSKRLMDVFFSNYGDFYNKAKANKNVCIVKYDKWMKDQEYRKQIAADLHLPFSDSSYLVPSSFSSFEGTDYEQQRKGLENMKPLYRWKEKLNDKKYIKLLKENKDCLEISAKEFDFDDDLQNFHNMIMKS